MFGILAIVCIILGFVTGFSDTDLGLNALTWFAAAIAFNTLSAKVPGFKRG